MKIHNVHPVKRNTLAFMLGKVGILGLLVTEIFAKWQDAGLTIANILFLQGLFSLFILVFEYPSGILADYLSRKQILVIGKCAHIVAIAVYLVSSSFTGFVVAEAFFGMALALASGADNAFIYDTHLQYNSKEQGSRAISQGVTIMIFTAGISLALGSFLAEISRSLPFWVTMGFNGVVITSYLISVEPTRYKQKSVQKVLVSSVKIVNNSVFWQTFALMAMVTVTLRILFWNYIPKLEAVNIDRVYHGLVIGAVSMAATLSSYLFAHKRVGEKVQGYFAGIAIVSTLFGTLLFFSNVAIIAIFSLVLHQVARGIIRSYSAVRLTREVGSDIRASVESLRAMSIDAVFLVLSTVLNILTLSAIEIQIINIIGFVFLLVLYIVARFSRYHIKKSKGLGQKFRITIGK